MLSQRVSNSLRAGTVARLKRKVITESFNRYQSTDTITNLKLQLNKAKVQYENNSRVSTKIGNLLDLLPSKVSMSSNENDFKPYTVKIGVIESKSIVSQNKPSILNIILSDPYESNQFWYKSIKEERESEENRSGTLSIFSYSPVFLNQYLDSNTLHFGIPSPILNRELRVAQKSKSSSNSDDLNKDLFNDIEFIEIGENYKPYEGKKRRLDNVKGINTIEFGTIKNKFNEDQCHFYIYVKNDKFEKIPDKYLGYPLLEVINSNNDTIGFTNTSPLPITTSLEKDINASNNNILVDLEKAETANNLLLESYSNVSKYLELIQKSNINELIHIIDKETSGYNPLIKSLKTLLEEINLLKGDKESSLTELRDKETEFRKEIEKWLSLSHFELQSKIIPFLEKDMIDKFSKINEIILNIDDYDLILGNYLLNSSSKPKKKSWFGFGNKKNQELHGSLKKSNEDLNYLNGKIDSELNRILGTSVNTIANTPDTAAQEIELNQPIKSLQKEIIENKLPTVQSEIHELVMKNLININFPTLAVCSVMNIIGYMDLQSGIAIVILSFVIGFNYVSKGSIGILKKFSTWYTQRIRETVDECGKLLNEKVTNRLATSYEKVNDKFDNFEKLEDGLRELEELEKRAK